jgi:starch phosphorylase
MNSPAPIPAAPDNSVAAIQRDIVEKLFCMLARFPEVATPHDRYLAVAYAVRDRLLRHWGATARSYYERASRTAVYLSAEFLIGPQLGKNLLNLGLTEPFFAAIRELGWDPDEILAQEAEPGLGNGGLGRLAACYLDSLATLELPSIAYGIRYEFGIFDQEIRDGWQVERSDRWLRFGYPWEIARPEIAFTLKLGGHTEAYHDAHGAYRVRWIPERVVVGTPCDTLVQGYGVKTVNLLRLWKAEAHESFDFRAFNSGDYYGAVLEKVASENITKVLYPNDEVSAGKQLRLEQQYFFVSCSLQDMIRIHRQRDPSLATFHRKYVAQLNDTHPAIAVAELMRLLVDENEMSWDAAWDITRQVFAYTNHTLLPEALERWPLPLFARILPRHLEIIFEINRRFLDEVRARFPGDDDRLRRLSLIDESGERFVRMAHLACVGSHAINGVAALHSRLLADTVLRDFHELWPEKFSNKTNGVTPRRFIALANPSLTRLITSRIGDRWIRDLAHLRDLEPCADDPEFRAEWQRVKLAAKISLARVVARHTGIELEPRSLFDVQAKRIHEYKRQHLNALHVAALYCRLRRNPSLDLPSRTFLFAGKAAPGYHFAKLIIRFINALSATIEAEPAVRDRLRVVFFPNFNVKSAQGIYPAADLSEQISTAGKEASGTGNMKFALNGALTIGTLDGANIEIRDQVGAENFFLFGLDASEVTAMQAAGYRPADVLSQDEELREVLDLIASGHFAGGDHTLFAPLVENLRTHDPYLVLADFRSYSDCQQRIGNVYGDADDWARRSILNVARMGYFSSDRAVTEYARDIWHVEPVPVA